MEQKVPRLVLAGTNSGCGKTTVTCAVLQALVTRGLRVGAAKCGPDYIDPMFHSRVIGAKSSNLDPFFFDRDTMRYLLAQAEHDKKIAGVVDAFHYQIGKEIGAMAAVMHGKVDQIILTGGIAYGKETVDAISEMVGWIAPITVYPGEDELLALAQGALRVLKGEEKAQEYRRPRPDDNN